MLTPDFVTNILTVVEMSYRVRYPERKNMPVISRFFGIVIAMYGQRSLKRIEPLE